MQDLCSLNPGDPQRDTASCRQNLEGELLLQYARRNPGPETTDRISLLLSCDLDWERFTDLVERNEVSGLVLRGISRADHSSMPERTLRTLRDMAVDNTSVSVRLASQLSSVLRLFGANAVLAMPLKGSALAMQLYGNFSTRQSGDVDVLVRRSDAFMARQILLSAGYRPLESDLEFRRHFSSAKHKHFTVLSPDRETLLEVHWAFLEPAYGFRLSASEVFQTAVPQCLLDEKIFCACPEHQLLLLAAHGCRHGWDSLKWICDVAELVCVPQLDLQAALTRAKDLGCYRMVSLALLLAADFLDAPVPSAILRDISTPALRPLIEGVRSKVLSLQPFVSAEHPSGVRAQIAYLRFALSCREKLRDRLRLVIHRFANLLRPNEQDRQFRRLPAVVRWFARPVRLFRIYGFGCFAELLGSALRGTFSN
ncbi:MAG: nucleotidyltransferase family protein [Acidobacteriaceae bacterium]|nr:nucleotidyltransferase family protein [Acidobacteriaceae bacterium]